MGLIFALVLSPRYLQENVRIMYVHVPKVDQSRHFSTIAFLSILNFIFKIKNFYIISYCLAPIEFLFTCLAIITGSVWEKLPGILRLGMQTHINDFLMILYFGLILVFKLYKNNDLQIRQHLLFQFLYNKFANHQIFSRLVEYVTPAIKY